MASRLNDIVRPTFSFDLEVWQMASKTRFLTSTSLAFLLVAPGQAQTPTSLTLAYDNYLAAQAAGDQDAIANTESAVQEECIIAGFPSLEACMAQVQSTAPVGEMTPGEAIAPAIEPPPAQGIAPDSEVAPGLDQPSPGAAASEEPAPATGASSASDPAVDAQAQFQINLNAALEQYQQALSLAGAGDFAAAQPLAEQSAATIEQLCAAEGFANIEACIGQPLPPLPQPPVEPTPEAVPEIAPTPDAVPAEEPALTQDAAPADELAPVPYVTPAEDVAPLQEQPSPETTTAEELAPVPAETPTSDPEVDAQAQFQTNLNVALEQYQQALGLADAGDFAAAQPLAEQSAATIEQLCAAEGFASIEACIGQALPPLPQPPVEPTLEAVPEIAPTPDAAPAEEPGVLEEAAPAEELEPTPETLPADGSLTTQD
ncbi:MAG TPA: hypothetical protein VGB81_13130, partial [Devosia sp.]